MAVTDVKSKQSPLPFGVLPAGYEEAAVNHQKAEIASPLPFGVLPAGYGRAQIGLVDGEDVSIAFRRSARWLLNREGSHKLYALRSPLPFGVLPAGYYGVVTYYGGPGVVCLHCLSAFCPLATVAKLSFASGARPRLHCLSAFCPLATTIGPHLSTPVATRLHCLSAFCPLATMLPKAT